MIWVAFNVRRFIFPRQPGPREEWWSPIGDRGGGRNQNGKRQVAKNAKARQEKFVCVQG
jgi:hypothetical protein